MGDASRAGGRLGRSRLRRRGRRGLAVTGVLVLGATGVSGLAGVRESASALGRLPSCDLGEVYTVPRGYDDWSVTLVDRLLRVESDYVPPDLVPSGLPGGGRIRAVALKDTLAMAKAARSAGAPIGAWSGYRSHAEQVQIFTGYSRQNGFDSAITYSQRPGHSEHQLGLAVDFMSAGGGNPLDGDWGKSAAGGWMRANSWQYGWVISYPRGAGDTRWNDKTCFRYEPWHYRFVGREVADEVHRSGLTLREYLWTHHTLLDEKGRPVASPTPTTQPVPLTSMATSSPTSSRVLTSTVAPSTTVPPRSGIASTPPSSMPTGAGPLSEPAESAGIEPARMGLAAGVLAVLAVVIGLARRRRSGST